MAVSPVPRCCRLAQPLHSHDRLSSAVILIDGECVLCHRLARFVLRRDRRIYFRFASLQSKAAQQLLRDHAYLTETFDTVVVVDEGQVLVQSDAALRVLQRLPWPWPWLAWSRVLPRTWRDAVYRWVGHRRYRWFGRREYCLLPEDWPPERRLREDDAGLL